MPDDVVMLDEQTSEVLSFWDLKPGMWSLAGIVRTSLEGVTRPIVEVAGQRYLLRRQPDDLTERDTIFRHTFMRHLAAQGLPVPALLARPDGHTYAVAENGIYELQAWQPGRPFTSDAALADDWLSAAAATLGALHQASADFQWQPRLWPEERSTEAIAQAYLRLIAERAEGQDLPESVRAGLSRVAEEAASRLDDAVEALTGGPPLPQLHIHGDFQAHNLAFDGARVAAIYDFDATHWARRIDELAYALFYFAGVRWDDEPSVTPPLSGDGLDILAVQRFLKAYGDEAPPADVEARLLADALTLAFPVVFANGVAEDLIFSNDYAEPPDEEDALARLAWADSFWLWLDRYRESLAQVWSAS